MAASAAVGRSAVVPGKRECMALLGALLVVVALAEPAAAAEYKVGDALGWTILGNPNYTAWALSKTFHVGDTIVFEYNKQFHNVLEVSRSNYKDCNAANPMSAQATGNDSITLKTAGHHYFLCGVPTHCAALGQRVDVNVLSSSAPAPASPAPASPAPARAPASPAPARAPASPAPAPSAPASSSTPAAPSVPSASSPSPSASTPPTPKSAASPSVGSGHYVAGCAVALLAVAMSLMRL